MYGSFLCVCVPMTQSVYVLLCLDVRACADFTPAFLPEDACMSCCVTSGHITREQLQQLLNKAGLRPTQAQLGNVWRTMDPSMSGRAGLRDFIRACGQVREDMRSCQCP